MSIIIMTSALHTIHHYIHTSVHANKTCTVNWFVGNRNRITSLTGLETCRGPEEDHVVIALLSQVRAGHTVFLEMKLFPFPSQSAD